MFGCVVFELCQERKVYLWQLEGHSNTPAGRDNQERERERDGLLNIARMKNHSDCSSIRKLEPYHTSSIMLDTSSTRCVKSRVWQWYSLSWILDWTCMKLCTRCQEASLLHQLVSLFETVKLIVTPPRVMIHPFCCVSGLHQRA